MKEIFNFSYKYIKKEKKYVIVILFLMAVSTLINLYIPLIYKYIIDSIFAKRQFCNFVYVIVGYFSLFITRELLNTYKFYHYGKLGTKIFYKIRKDLFSHLLSLPVKFFNTTKQGDIIERLSGDVSVIERFISETFIEIISQGLIFIFALSFLLYLNAKITILSLILMVVYPYIFKFAGKRISKYTKIEKEQSSRMVTIINEALNNILLVKSSNKEKTETIEFCKTNRLYGISKIRGDLTMGIAAVMAEIFASMPNNLILLLLGGYAIQKGSFTIGELLAFGLYLNYLTRPINVFFQISANISRVKISINRILEYLNLESENDSGKIVFEGLKSEIIFKDISFQYEESLVLNNLNLRIRKGSQIAIVGESGAGKSTIANLLLRYNETDLGEILIDGKNIKDYSLRAIRSKIGIVWQEPFFFNRSIKENLLYGTKEKISDEKIIRVSKLAYIHDFIESLPQKYDTVIGERGVKISGGEKQRLAIARAILKNPDILILDEASSHLDNNAETFIHQKLQEVFKEKTIIIIAHRLSTIINADEIFVLGKNGIIEKGRHDQLLENKNAYYKLWNNQTNKLDEE